MSSQFGMAKIREMRVFLKLKDVSAKWWHKSYAQDWGIAIALFVVVHLATFFVEPVNRFLPVNDSSVMYPLVPDIVPSSVLFIIAMLVPWIVIGLMQLRHKSVHDFHHASTVLIFCILLTNTVTTALKYAAGRYRPNYMAELDTDARLSFPSGHASNSFAGMTFLVLYLMGKLQVYREEHASNFGKTVLVTSPMCLAFFVAISRTIDYHHNYSDVIAGSLVGYAVAYYVYFMYYPALTSKNSHLPKLHIELIEVTANIELSGISVITDKQACDSANYDGKAVVDSLPPAATV